MVIKLTKKIFHQSIHHFYQSESYSETHKAINSTLDNSPTSEQVQSQHKLTGRRIINISSFWKQLQNIKHVPYFNCSILNCEIISENRLGLKSTFTIECRMCKLKSIINSDSNEDQMDINCATVLGTYVYSSTYVHIYTTARIYGYSKYPRYVQLYIHRITFPYWN